MFLEDLKASASIELKWLPALHNSIKLQNSCTSDLAKS